jgi:hypothetical protein
MLQRKGSRVLTPAAQLRSCADAKALGKIDLLVKYEINIEPIDDFYGKATSSVKQVDAHKVNDSGVIYKYESFNYNY